MRKFILWMLLMFFCLRMLLMFSKRKSGYYMTSGSIFHYALYRLCQRKLVLYYRSPQYTLDNLLGFFKTISLALSHEI